MLRTTVMASGGAGDVEVPESNARAYTGWNMFYHLS